LTPTTPKNPLAVLGTEPAEQGKGYGRALLEPLLERCDREAMPTYLESSSRRNLSLYEPHGFNVIKELKIGKNGPSMWPMWREPR
jgi:GNAT superfamily N-acetyltransferase